MSRITQVDLDALALRLERAMLARGVFSTPDADEGAWNAHVLRGSGSPTNSREWTLWLRREDGALAHFPAVDSERIGRSPREAALTLSALITGLCMVRQQDVHGYTLRDHLS